MTGGGNHKYCGYRQDNKLLGIGKYFDGLTSLSFVKGVPICFTPFSMPYEACAHILFTVIELHY